MVILKLQGISIKHADTYQDNNGSTEKFIYSKHFIFTVRNVGHCCTLAHMTPKLILLENKKNTEWKTYEVNEQFFFFKSHKFKHAHNAYISNTASQRAWQQFSLFIYLFTGIITFQDTIPAGAFRV